MMLMSKKTFISILATLISAVAFGQEVLNKDFTKPEATEIWKPLPKVVTPGVNGSAPSDAIVLFDGTSLSQWVMASDGTSCQWLLHDGTLTVKPGSGDIQTKQKFGDCQLHIEFMIPEDAVRSADHNNAGNSGIFLQERYEVQIFDSYHNETPLYVNGQTGSIYKQSIPMANASNKPGQWNTFDIFYTAPTFHYNGSLNTPAYVTVVHNGILILNHFQIQGTIQYIGIPRYELHGKGSIRLQEHHSPVSFRNIWIREL